MIAPPLVHHGPAATSQEGWAGGWFQCPMNMSQKFVSFSIDKSFLVLVLGPWSLSQLLSGLPGVPAATAAAGRGAYPEGECTTLYVIALQGHWSVLSSPVKHMQFFHSNLQKSVPQPFRKQSLIHKPPFLEHIFSSSVNIVHRFDAKAQSPSLNLYESGLSCAMKCPANG